MSSAIAEADSALRNFGRSLLLTAAVARVAMGLNQGGIAGAIYEIHKIGWEFAGTVVRTVMTGGHPLEGLFSGLYAGKLYEYIYSPPSGESSNDLSSLPSRNDSTYGWTGAERIAFNNHNSGSDNNSSSNSSRSNRFGWNFPIVIDMDGDGIEITPLHESTTNFDFDNDEYPERTAWTKPDDALLVFDIENDNRVTQPKEISFALWTEEDDTDLQALAAQFDTNNDKSSTRTTQTGTNLNSGKIAIATASPTMAK